MIEIRTVGVIGAGQMGAGIAHVSALAGYDVLVNDVSVERVESALATINGNMARQIAKGAITDSDRKAALKRIECPWAIKDKRGNLVSNLCF